MLESVEVVKKLAVVIGGGPMGLLCALELKTRVPSADVHVWEARNKETLEKNLSQQAVSLSEGTIETIGQLNPSKSDIPFCDANRNGIIAVSDLEKTLRTWCLGKGVIVHYGVVVKWVFTQEKQIHFVCHQDVRILSPDLIVFATGHRVGVPRNIFGVDAYQILEDCGHALVGIANYYTEAPVVQPQCSSSILGKKAAKMNMSWKSTSMNNLMDAQQDEQSTLLVLTNYTSSRLTVAIGCKGNLIKKWIDTLESSESGSSQSSAAAGNPSDTERHILLRLLVDGLWRVHGDVAFNCNVVMEWLDHIHIIQFGDYSDESNLWSDMMVFDLFSCSGCCVPRFQVVVSKGEDPRLRCLRGSRGVSWNGSIWFVEKIDAFLGRDTHDPEEKGLIASFTRNSLTNPPVPGHICVVNGKCNVGKDAQSLLYTMKKSHDIVHGITPFLPLHHNYEDTDYFRPDVSGARSSCHILSLPSRVENIKSEDTQMLLNTAFESSEDFQSREFRSELEIYRMVKHPSITNLMTDLVKEVRAKEFQNEPQPVIEFADSAIKLVDIRVQVLKECAKIFGLSVVLAMGDCARSPNFFSSSGINVGVKGLDAIGREWENLCNGNNKIELVDKLNESGEELNNEIIVGHQDAFMSYETKKKSPVSQPFNSEGL